jgi:hypothetical protein
LLDELRINLLAWWHACFYQSDILSGNPRMPSKLMPMSITTAGRSANGLEIIEALMEVPYLPSQ